MNAKKELLGHIESREVKYVRVIRKISYSSEETVEGTLDEENFRRTLAECPREET